MLPMSRKQILELALCLSMGLNGTSPSTWLKDRDTDVCWPEKCPPQEPKFCAARLLSFGYRSAASPTSLATILNVTDFGKNLPFCMKYGKDERKEDLNVGEVCSFLNSIKVCVMSP